MSFDELLHLTANVFLTYICYRPDMLPTSQVSFYFFFIKNLDLTAEVSF